MSERLGRLKILFLADGPHVSGKEIVTLSQANGLKALGHHVVVAASKWNDGDFLKRLNAAQLPTWILPAGFITKTWRADAIALTMKQILHLPELYFGYLSRLARLRPDYVFHTNFHHVCLLMPWIKGDRDWMIVHEVYPLSRFYSLVFNHIAESLAGFIAVSASVASALVALGICPGRIQIIPNGIDLPSLAKEKRKNEGDWLKVGVVGQIAPWKGHEDGVQALKIVSEQGIKVKLLIYGADNGGYSNRLKLLIGELSLGEHVFWGGYVVDRQTIYENIDVLLVPSRYDEPFGLVAVEAGAYSLPVIATESGELPNLVEDGVTGFVVPKRDPKALAGAIKCLVDVGKRARMGAAGHSSVHRRFSADAMVAKFNQFLMQVSSSKFKVV